MYELLSIKEREPDVDDDRKFKKHKKRIPALPSHRESMGATANWVYVFRI